MKKIYDKPLTNITTVRNQHTFCSSIYENKSVQAQGHEKGNDYTFGVDGKGSSINGETAKDGEFSIVWE